MQAVWTALMRPVAPLPQEAPARRPSLRAGHDAQRGLCLRRARPLVALQRRQRRQLARTGPPGSEPGPAELYTKEASAAEQPAGSEPASNGSEAAGTGHPSFSAARSSPASELQNPALSTAAEAAAAAAAAATAGGQPVATASAEAAVAHEQGQQQQAPGRGPSLQPQPRASSPQQQPESSSEQQRRPLQVPWGLSTTVTLMMVWLVAFWFAAYTGVPALIQLLGLDAASTVARVQALKHFLLDLIQLGLTVVILQRGLHGFEPRKLGLFSLSWSGWRTWLLPLGLGAATFPGIDWVHKQLVTLLSADDYLLGGTVEQIASASDWAAYALWFAVLAVCAPLWEELMFRGFLLPSVGRHLPPWAAVVVTAAVFSMVHFTREGFLPLLLLGLVFGAVYVRTRSLWPPIILHSLWNVLLLAQIVARGAAGA